MQLGRELDPFPIEIRLSGDDLSETGLNAEECIQVAKLIENKVDLFNISCGNHEDPELFCEHIHPHFILWVQMSI